MAFSKDYYIRNEAALTEVAAELAPLMENGAVVALAGDLGAGKTAFARALIRFLSENGTMDVPSPTFTLVQTYETKYGPLWHFDLYRLKHAEEVYELGWEDALACKGIVLIEWSERIAPLLPHGLMRINITVQADGTRIMKVRA